MAYISFKPKDYFNIVLYTGTAEENAVSGIGFQPDWVWFKNRAAGTHHTLFDAVRGANKVIYANLNAIQYTVTEELKSFDSDGFTVGTEAAENGDGNGIVSWNWKANGSGSSNTDGSINTIKTSANTTSGFSIVNYTGTGSAATVGHGLGAIPSVVLVKRTNSTGDWLMYHKSIGNGKNLRLNTAEAEDTSSAPWNATTPTSSVFSVGAFAETNGSSDTFVAYCFAEVKGFSKIGSYLGNGEASDNAFVYCGFKPKYILHKATIGENWMLWDSTRNTAVNSNGNPTQVIFEPNGAGAENNTSARAIDLLSNGFKIRGNNPNFGGSGTEYVFMAFADEPLVSTNGVPTTAR